jgi:signal peptidase II
MSERAVFGWRESGLAWWPLAIVTLVLDQFTKWLVQRSLAVEEFVYVLPVLDIVHAHNPGAAFSFLADAGGWQRWLFTGFALVVSVAILVALRRSAGLAQRLQNAGLMLIVSGALGNAIDRMRLGHVVDFVHVHWGPSSFPAFNVADSCISVGAGLILLDALLEWQRERRVARGKVQ